jgi:hypothetical protein
LQKNDAQRAKVRYHSISSVTHSSRIYKTAIARFSLCRS